MDKKEIQNKRMKKYFIQSAKRCVREEGVSKITVKKIADLAGYSPGTLYNYFKDLNELLYYCADEFFTECKELLLEEEKKYTSAKDKVINLARAYGNYFLKNPNIYRLLFLYDLGEPPAGFIKRQGYVPEAVLLYEKNLQKFAEEGGIDECDIKIVLDLIGHIVHGNLLFYIKKRRLFSEEDVIKKIENEARYIFCNE